MLFKDHLTFAWLWFQFWICPCLLDCLMISSKHPALIFSPVPDRILLHPWLHIYIRLCQCNGESRVSNNSNWHISMPLLMSWPAICNSWLELPRLPSWRIKPLWFSPTNMMKILPNVRDFSCMYFSTQEGSAGFPVNQQGVTLGNSSLEGGELSYDLFIQLFWNIFDPSPEGNEMTAYTRKDDWLRAHTSMPSKGKKQVYLENTKGPGHPLGNKGSTIIPVITLHIL